MRLAPQGHFGPTRDLFVGGGLTPILGFEAGSKEGIGPGVGNTCDDTTNQSGTLERHKSVFKIQAISVPYYGADITILLPQVRRDRTAG